MKPKGQNAEEINQTLHKMEEMLLESAFLHPKMLSPLGLCSHPLDGHLPTLNASCQNAVHC